MITKISGGRVISERRTEETNVYIEDGKIIKITKSQYKKFRKIHNC